MSSSIGSVYINTLIKLNQFELARIAIDSAKQKGIAREAFDQFTHVFVKQQSGITTQHNGNPPQKHLQQLIDLYNRGEYLKTLELATRMLCIFSASDVLFNIQGAAHTGLDNIDLAIISYRRALKIKPENSDALNNLGGLLQAKGDLDGGINHFTQAITVKPEYAEAYFNLGNALKGKGDIDGSVASYLQAVRINPNYAEAYNNMGIAQKQKGDLDGAVATLKNALVISPKYAEAHNNLGSVLHEKGNLDASLLNYRRALSINPDYIDAYCNMGIALYDSGRYEDSILSYNEAIKRHNQYDGKLDDIKRAHAFRLRSLFALNDNVRFGGSLSELVQNGHSNALVGSLCSRATLHHGLNLNNPFCNKPLDYVAHTTLSKRYNFESVFVNPARAILRRSDVHYKPQNLLVNAFQTSGNIFASKDYFSIDVLEIIHAEIKRYRYMFRGSGEGFLVDWPNDYTLYGWLVAYHSGGSIRPHIHENGWISGSIYINVPKSTQQDEGNLFVSLDDREYDVADTSKSGKVVEVNSGSLCLFPASLHHCTTPFQSTDERIVLAFDVLEKSSPS